MEDLESYKKKLSHALKLNGIIIRSEFCSLIIESLHNAHINLKNLFENCIRVICENLEKHIDANHSIERKHVERAIEACIRSGIDDHETKFAVLDAFEFPKLAYDLTRKVYSIDKKNKPKLCSKADNKTDVFRNRYRNVLQRTQRSLITKNASLADKKITLHPVDHLLSVSERSLCHSLILGSLFQGTYNKWYIEDPTGMVQVDLTDAKFHGGFFYESCFVLVNGHYSDKILQVSTMILPPAEEYKDSKSCFASINYFGGQSDSLLRESNKLVDLMEQNDSGMMVFVSDLCLDNSITFEKLNLLFEGLSEMPPIAFIFMGNFLSQSYGSERFEVLTKAFKDLAGMVYKYDNLVKYSSFVFVPGMNDPCCPHILPRAPLPKLVSEPFTKLIPKSTFATNPCRIQYCSREITILRSDVLSKFMQESINKPKTTDQIDDFIAKTITAQGHISPFSLNVQPIHWSFDHTLHLYPLPNLVVIGDKCNPYHGKTKGCTVINPGSFIDSGFAFKTYVPATDSVENCGL